MAKKPRVLIASDENGKWYARRIKFVSHDLDADEKVYRCDLPIGAKYDTPEQALVVVRQYLGE